MSICGIQDQLLEVTVVGANKLKDTEWISRQDPYVWVEYGSTKFRTRTCTDGGKNPTFQEKFTFTLIEGLRELNLGVWNSNTINHDDFIGSGKVRLQKVLSQGYDDSAWSLHSNSGRSAGEVRLILHYSNANVSSVASNFGIAALLQKLATAQPYGAHSVPQVPLYSTPPPPASLASYPPPACAYPAPSPYPSYLPNSAAYPPGPCPPTQLSAYPQPYPPPSAYLPSSAFPPSPSPPPPQSSPYHPPGPYPGTYPPLY